jgi:hypothetical protein
MTAKQAIKARCRDCSGRKCGFEECALKRLAAYSPATIREDDFIALQVLRDAIKREII